MEVFGTDTILVLRKLKWYQPSEARERKRGEGKKFTSIVVLRKLKWYQPSEARERKEEKKKSLRLF